MMNQNWSQSAKEKRLIHYGDFPQLGRDIRDFHLRADDPLAAAGSVVMPLAVGASKFGNTIVGHFSDVKAEPLQNGAFKYISRDVWSAGKNLFAAGKNVATGHPLNAIGNAFKSGLDGLDATLVDPLLDIGSNLFGHQNKKTRFAMNNVLSSSRYIPE